MEKNGSRTSLASQRIARICKNLQESAKKRVNECEYAKNWKIIFAVLCIFLF